MKRGGGGGGEEKTDMKICAHMLTLILPDSMTLSVVSSCGSVVTMRVWDIKFGPWTRHLGAVVYMERLAFGSCRTIRLQIMLASWLVACFL